jgi:hypothetical protein
MTTLRKPNLIVMFIGFLQEKKGSSDTSLVWLYEPTLAIHFIGQHSGGHN